jgi:hypothetical protein
MQLVSSSPLEDSHESVVDRRFQVVVVKVGDSVAIATPTETAGNIHRTIVEFQVELSVPFAAAKARQIPC